MEQSDMTQRRAAAVGLWAITATLGALTPYLSAEEETSKRADPVRIGMVDSLFREVPKPMMSLVMQPFATLMQQQTGLTGQIVADGEFNNLSQDLATDKVQLGVFHGFEFAWARQKHPELKPLMIAVIQQPHLFAYLVVRSDSEVNSLTDLKGGDLALSRGTREHCKLFLEKYCKKQGHDPKQFFGKITVPPNPEDALDKVFEEEVQATVVDNVALESYKRRKPGRFEQLAPMLRSEVFPAGVVAYRPGAIDADTLRRFREGMSTANQSALGRQLMTLWKLTAFEPVPADYEQTLTDIAKAYPVPEVTAKAEKKAKK
jgi:ABC-type phosphate/phosphonate transport system substrate-binding protein